MSAFAPKQSRGVKGHSFGLVRATNNMPQPRTDFDRRAAHHSSGDRPFDFVFSRTPVHAGSADHSDFPHGNPLALPISPAAGILQTKRDADGSRSLGPDRIPPVVHEVVTSPGKPLDAPTRGFMESRLGHDFSQVRVHTDEQAAGSAHAINASAYTMGDHVVFGSGQFAPASGAGRGLLAHELTHVVQQRAGVPLRNGIGEVGDRYERQADQAARAIDQGPASSERPELAPASAGPLNPPLQRAVRIGGGATHVDEKKYQAGGSGAAIGGKRLVKNLIADPVHRVFNDATELEDFANGKTDYIGDVVTKGAGTFWYRLPKSKLTVLGETHENPRGNSEDVILGLQTHRFMYEAYNELAPAPALDVPFTGTQSRLNQVNAGMRTGGMVDRSQFSPDLENIVIKALTGAAITRNEFIPANPPTMNAAEQKKWGRRPSKSDYSFGERAALYLAMGMHLASDLAKHDFGADNLVESPFVKSGRKMKEFYLANRGVLDTFMTTKDGDDLIGIYELTAPNNFKDLPVIRDFTLVLHEYGSLYIEHIGAQSGNKKLEAAGTALEANPGVKLEDLSPAREEIMWGKIQKAVGQGYLLVGMGEAHRASLEPRLNKAGIANEEVETSLNAQKTAVDAAWKP
jgi:hypothetical protein